MTYFASPRKQFSLMASQKVRSPAMQRFFKTLTYNMYAFVLEKPLRLVGRNFCLAISFDFARPSSLHRRILG